MGQIDYHMVDLESVVEMSPLILVVRCLAPVRTDARVELTGARESDGAPGSVTAPVTIWHFERARVLKNDCGDEVPASFGVIENDAEDYAMQIAEYELRGLDQSPIRRSYRSSLEVTAGPTLVGQELLAFLRPPEEDSEFADEQWDTLLRTQFRQQFVDHLRFAIDTGLESMDKLSEVQALLPHAADGRMQRLRRWLGW